MSIESSWRRFAVRRLDMGPLLDLFLISAVSCLLGIRLFLHLAGYPQLGNDSLHIAHMLWGGLGMMVAIVLFMALPVRLATQLAAFIGGLGFGAFIDELGKFITQDNDYFFQPTIGIIYLVFIALYLTFRQLEGVGRRSEATNMVNALEVTKEAALRAMDESERRRALALLAECDQADPLVRGLSTALNSYESVPAVEPGRLQRLKGAAVRLYRRLIEWRWFGGVLVAAAVTISVVSLGLAVASVWINAPRDLGFEEWGSIVSAIISGLLTLVGVLVYRRSRLRAYKLFDAGVLVGIFVGQFFNFLQSELGAITGLAFLLICHGALRYLIDQEQTVRAEDAARRSSAPSGVPAEESGPAA